MLLLSPMNLDDFDFALAPALIAQSPLPERSASRLLCLDANTGQIEHNQFKQLPDMLTPADLLVFNNTRVVPARLYGKKETGGSVEVLIERVVDDHLAVAQIKASKAPKQNSQLLLSDSISVTVLSRNADLYRLQFQHPLPIFQLLEKFGHTPLPPYIAREDDSQDRARYQTVYAQEKGAVAAPTAGLHFDQSLLQVLTDKGIEQAFITLHVGAGTFQPIRTNTIKDHKMHAELISVSEIVCEQIQDCKNRGGRVIAVGTTTVRALETAAKDGDIKPFRGDTDIFIYPDYKFNCIDALITNFHLPKSSLLMLVSAFAGYENIMSAYQAAMQQKYRFYSYGDAMFIGRC